MSFFGGIISQMVEQGVATPVQTVQRGAQEVLRQGGQDVASRPIATDSSQTTRWANAMQQANPMVRNPIAMNTTPQWFNPAAPGFGLLGMAPTLELPSISAATGSPADAETESPVEPPQVEAANAPVEAAQAPIESAQAPVEPQAPMTPQPPEI